MRELLTQVRRALGQTAEDSVAYRITLEREPDADRATYVKRVKSITEGLEASIRDAGSGSFESVEVSRTAGTYSRTMAEIADVKKQKKDIEARLHTLEETGGGLLSFRSASDVASNLDEASHSLETLRNDRRHHVKNTFVYTVFFAPKSPQTTEAIASEFGRLGALSGVEAVELENDAPYTDPRTSIDFRAQEDRDR